MRRSASTVFSALLLLGLTLFFGSLLFLQLRVSSALEPRPRPLLVRVADYNSTHHVYYVASGCLEAPVLLWNGTEWAPAAGACRGSLVVAGEEVSVYAEG